MRYSYKLATVLVQLGTHICSICRPGSVLLVHARKRANSDDMLGAEPSIACRGLIHVPSALGSTVVLTPLGEQFALRLLRARPNTELEDREGELWRGKRWGTYLQQALRYFLTYKKDVDYTISTSPDDGSRVVYQLDRDTGAAVAESRAWRAFDCSIVVRGAVAHRHAVQPACSIRMWQICSNMCSLQVLQGCPGQPGDTALGSMTWLRVHAGRALPMVIFGNLGHQFLHAKHGIPVGVPHGNSRSITYAAFFRRFKKFAGMTGTATSIANTLWDIYSLPVRCCSVRPRSSLLATTR